MTRAYCVIIAFDVIRKPVDIYSHVDNILHEIYPVKIIMKRAVICFAYS